MVEGGTEAENADDEDHDSLESKLIVRLHCKHGNFFTIRSPFRFHLQSCIINPNDVLN